MNVEAAVLFIQRLFRFNRSIKTIKEHFNCEPYDFDKSVRFVMRPTVLSHSKLITEHFIDCNPRSNVSSKLLLTCFMTHRYPDISEGHNSSVLKRIAELVITLLQPRQRIVPAYCLYLGHLLVYFKVLLDEWKDSTKPDLLNQLSMNYYDTCFTLSLIDSAEYREELGPAKINDIKETLQEQCEKTLKYAKQIDRQNGVNFVKHFKPSAKDEEMLTQISGTCADVYWRVVSDKIKEDPMDPIVLKLLIEIRDRLCALVSNNKEMTTQIHEGIDIDLLKQMFQHRAIDEKDMKKQMETLFHFLSKFCSADMDEEVKNFRLFFAKAAEDIPHNTLLATFFRDYFSFLEDVELRIKMLRQQKPNDS